MRAEPVRLCQASLLGVRNDASRRNWAAAAQLSDAYPNAQMVYLPVHASWQVSGSTTGGLRTR